MQNYMKPLLEAQPQFPIGFAKFSSVWPMQWVKLILHGCLNSESEPHCLHDAVSAQMPDLNDKPDTRFNKRRCQLHTSDSVSRLRLLLSVNWDQPVVRTGVHDSYINSLLRPH